MGKEQGAVCSDGLVFEVEALVLSEVGFEWLVASKKHILAESAPTTRPWIGSISAQPHGIASTAAHSYPPLGALALLG